MSRLRVWSRRRFALWFALSSVAGALTPIAGPMWLGIGVLAVAVLCRRRPLLLAAVFLAVGIFASNALGGLVPLPVESFEGSIELLSNPRMLPGRLQADVNSEHGRLRLSASDSSATELRGASIGDRFVVRGTLRPLDRSEYVQSRHLRSSLVVREVRAEDGRSSWRLPVDVVRTIVSKGASVLPHAQQSVYSGFVIGDDRDSDVVVRSHFENSGLSHLLVVSGQNVVFVIAVLTPATRRLGRRTRIITVGSCLLLFAAVTRFEPSVLRATTMAMIATVGSESGRPVAALDRLSMAVAMLLCIDPLLVRSLGFQLSTAATAGIALFAQSIAERLRGPRWFRQILAVTVAAQLAVAPLVIPVFGPMPLASLPANLLAEPVAGFVMMWGSSVGLLAGVLGGLPAKVMMLPVQIGVWWIMGVAEWCSELPLPSVDLPFLVIACSVFGGLVWSRRMWRVGAFGRRSRRAAG